MCSWENNKERNEENIRRPLLLHETLTNITWEKYKVQLIISQVWNKLQHMSNIKQTSVEYEI